MLTIGELAGLTGTTARTIRHHQAVGALPEPARRVNGYREYDLRDAVRLVRVRRLVQLGLPLREVAAARGPGRSGAGSGGDRELREVLAELDAELAEQLRVLGGRRRRLAELLDRPGDVALSQEVVHLLGDVRTASPDATPAALGRERDLLEMIEVTQEPAQFAAFAAQYREALADPRQLERITATAARFEALATADADDPGVDELAREMAAQSLEQVPGAGAEDDSWRPAWEAFLVTLPPAQRRCTEGASRLRQRLTDAGGPA